MIIVIDSLNDMDASFAPFKCLFVCGRIRRRVNHGAVCRELIKNDREFPFETLGKHRRARTNFSNKSIKYLNLFRLVSRGSLWQHVRHGRTIRRMR